jgi:two-component system sensor histidine kinase DegS
MMAEIIDPAILDKIITDTIKHLEDGKDQISDIAETARQNRDGLKENLDSLKRETLEVIEQVDVLEIKEKEARLHLMKVSRDFEKYTEKDVELAYNNARDIQFQLGLFRERESQLRIRRDQTELMLRKVYQAVEKAESLVSKVGVALNYLADNLISVGLKIEELQQKQQLGLRIIRAQEEERKRVAREIHDGPAQSMANVVLRAEICEKLLEKRPDEVREELAGLKDIVRKSLQDVRKIIFDLRPMVLDDLGLIPALKRYIAGVQEKSPLFINFQVSGSQERMSGTLEIAIFRVIQEALNNVIKHSGAGMADIYLEQMPEQVNLRIRDDGCGFDADEALSGTNKDSYGLIGIRERVQLLEGSFRLVTAPHQGTDLKVMIPLKPPEEQRSRKNGRN